ncbi:cytochrome P450 family protein [Streptomonospora nanhaiensis]|uniref:cytochrome P450 family protein n=1 Tax=Streptomonospora nanhaiensis TaxID=1323731 RepID=UPI001C3824C5|nr:cytochrome P450 [Streptomonospora nanhaiensis]MBV2363094.1 cytochrome P450 [Streptomonospora nanhaiensis]
MTAPAQHNPADTPADSPAVSLLDPELLTDPYTGFGRLREEAPVERVRHLDGSTMWLVTRQDDVRTVLDDPRFVNDPARIENGPGDMRATMLASVGIPEDYIPYIADTILDSDPPDHTRLRKLVSRAFTVRRVNELRPRVEEITADLLDRLPGAAGDDGAVDLIEHFAYPLPITVICEMVGVPEADRPLWRDWGTRMMGLDPASMASAFREMIDHIHAMVAERRARPADALLDALIAVRDDDGDRLTETELVTMVLTLVIAGHETTAHLIGNGTHALLTHPEQARLLREDPGLAPRAVHELMRWCGPVLFTRPRWAAEDVDLGGTLIRKGHGVEAVLVSANHDPRHYTEPERLDITRTYDTRGEHHLGFGHGLHYCLGAALARQEGEVAFTQLLGRFPGLALAVPEDQARWMPRPGLRRLVELPVRLG